MQYKYKLQIYILPVIILPVLVVSLIFIHNTKRSIMGLQTENMNIKVNGLVDKCANEYGILNRLAMTDVDFYVLGAQNKVIELAEIVNIPGGYVFIVDSNGNMVHHPELKNSASKKKFNHIDFIKTIASRKNGEITYNKTIYGKTAPEHIAFFQYFDKWDWIMVATSDKKIIYRGIGEATRLSVIALAGSIMLAIVILFLIARNISRPIEALKECSIKISRGDLESRVDIKSKDELGIFALTFNKMVENTQISSLEQKKLLNKLKSRNTELQVARKELTELNANLEQRVKDRTFELSKANKELDAARKTAESANRAKSEFLASMSHELRTPLNSILGFCQLMGRDPAVTKSLRENLSIINRSGAHLLALINDVLDMSKIEAGRTPLNKESFDLHRTLDVIEEMIRSRAGGKGLQFIVNRAIDLPRYIRTDKSKLRQVLLNLLGNAVKFTNEGQIVLRVQSSKLKAESKIESFQYPPSSIEQPVTSIEQRATRIQFQISDTGPGISPEDLEKIFDPFVQKRSDQTPSEGTGLGLAISRKFVQMMSGDIAVESAVGKGSTFKFDIRVELSDKAEIETEKPSPRIIELVPGQHIPRILVVEDNLANRALLCRLLLSVGFEVYEAVNGKEAIEQYEKLQPGLIWMDIRMPVMDGLEATRRIREIETRNLKLETRNAEDRTPSFPDEAGSPLRSDQHPVSNHVPIVALTAHAFEEEKEVILAAGCDDLVRKPFREAEIFDAMARHLDVSYVYEETEERKAKGEGEPPRDALTPEALAQLPDELLAELKQAILDLDVDLIQAIIKRIRGLNGPVGDGLADLARDFQYDKILVLIQRSDNKMDTDKHG